MSIDTPDVATAASKPDEKQPEYPLCSTCGSHRVYHDAWASWDPATQDWVLAATFDYVHCDNCGGEASLEWKQGTPDRIAQIRDLNDALRRNSGRTGNLVITAGVTAEGEALIATALKAVAEFDVFTKSNDPHQEHDFGAVTVEGLKLFFKIDYFDKAMEALSHDPADPSVTTRVLTIMLAEEY